MTRQVHLLCGVPGVGKSAWAQEECDFLDHSHETVALISRDQIRFTLNAESINTDYFRKENEVFDEFIRQVNEVIEIGVEHVFVDATHITPQARAKVLRRLVVDPSTELVCEVMDCDIATALERNKMREGPARVPESAIKRMWVQFKAPTTAEFVNNTFGFSRVIIHHHKEV